MKIKCFASDNYSTVHPKIIKALSKVNNGHEASYGNDIYTLELNKIFNSIFGECYPYLVYSGTGANILAIKSFIKSFQAIICTDQAHIDTHETGGLENYTGSKIIKLKSINGKLNSKDIKNCLEIIGDEHSAQPKIISISQPTEIGTIYSLEEIKDIVSFAKKNNMFVHMDGARISNAAVAMNLDFADFTSKAGIDVLSFGGTKNGMMMGEAVIFFNKAFSEDFKFIRKQGMQLYSKMRYTSCQFIEFFKDNLWRKNALNANNMANYLAEQVSKIKNIKITRPVETNTVFAIIPLAITKSLQEKFPFYIWDFKINEVRWVTSFDTNKKDIDNFVFFMKKLLNNV